MKTFHRHLRIYQESVLEKISTSEKIITLDPHHEYVGPAYWERWKKILSKVHIFFPSEDEFICLTGIDKKLSDINEYKPYLEKMSEMGPAIIPLKLGERGVLLYDGVKKKFYHVPTVAEKVVDVTGAGDAFAGGFLSGYLQTGDPFIAAMYGTVSSSIVLENFGALFAFGYDKNIAKKKLDNLKKSMGVSC